jgi:mitogen-activated protein kinase 15
MWSIGCIIAELLVGRPLFAGNSTLNQFEKIVEYMGEISKEDILAIDSPVAEQLLAQIKVKSKSFREYFNHVDQDFYPLIQGLLLFNPMKRLTAE